MKSDDDRDKDRDKDGRAPVCRKGLGMRSYGFTNEDWIM
jgi:hypothetical protein